MGLIIYLIVVLLCIYGTHLGHKKDISYNYIDTIVIILLVVQLLSILGDINIPYSGYPLEFFSSEFAYYIAVSFFYIGYFFLSIVALLLIYIPIFIHSNKKTQNNKDVTT